VLAGHRNTQIYVVSYVLLAMCNSPGASVEAELVKLIKVLFLRKSDPWHEKYNLAIGFTSERFGHHSKFEAPCVHTHSKWEESLLDTNYILVSSTSRRVWILAGTKNKNASTVCQRAFCLFALDLCLFVNPPRSVR